MDLNKILELGAQLFKNGIDQSGDGLDKKDVVVALSKLLADSNGKINLQSLVQNFDAKGLMSLAATWLGDGENATIAPKQVEEVFESGKLGGFAKQLGLDKSTALKGLSSALPGMLDHSSKGGSLMDSIGGLGDALGGLKGLFG